MMRDVCAGGGSRPLGAENVARSRDIKACPVGQGRLVWDRQSPDWLQGNSLELDGSEALTLEKANREIGGPSGFEV